MAGQAIRVSTRSTGEQVNGASAGAVFLSDNRTLVFSSAASDLVADDTNGTIDVFSKDLVTGRVTKITSGLDGSPLAADVTGFAISANGASLAYTTSGATAGAGDLYTKDLVTGSVDRIARGAAHPSLSADGKILVFSSSDSALVAGDTNGFTDVFAKNLATGLVTRVSTSSSGAQATQTGLTPELVNLSRSPSGTSDKPFVSADGLRVAFTSAANDLSTADVKDHPDVYIKDLATGALSIVATVSEGGRGSSGNYSVGFAADGNAVLVANTALSVHGAGYSSVYNFSSVNVSSGRYESVVTSQYLQGGGIFDPVYAPDARMVAYSAPANLSVGQTSAVYLKDLTSGRFDLLSESPSRDAIDARATAFSPDGTRLAFVSASPNVTAGDTNGVADIFIRDLTDPVFGQRAYDASTTGGKIYALYDALLGRAPDAVGLSAHAAAADGGVALRDLAQGMLQSPEGQARAGAVGNAEFMTQLYRAALHRDPDAPGLDNWVRFLDGGGARADVGLGFALSTEHLNLIQGSLGQGVWVADATASAAARLYYGVLNRSPDAPGLSDWTGVLKQGASIVNVAQVFLNSSEGQSLNRQGDAAFVDGLYVNALGRHAETAGLTAWTNYLGQGGSRAELAVAISEGAEAQAHLTGVIEKGWFLV